MGLCKALQDNKCFGGTESCSHFGPNSQKNVRKSAATGERTAEAEFLEEQLRFTEVEPRGTKKPKMVR